MQRGSGDDGSHKPLEALVRLQTLLPRRLAAQRISLNMRMQEQNEEIDYRSWGRSSMRASEGAAGTAVCSTLKRYEHEHGRQQSFLTWWGCSTPWHHTTLQLCFTYLGA